MVFWLVLALMTGVAAFAAIGPLLRRRPRSDTADADLAIYRDQLNEIERDLSLGALAPTEAEAARIEVSRRLLAAADRAKPNAAPSPSPAPAASTPTWRRPATGVLIALPLLAVVVYLGIGSPGLPGQPLAERVARLRANEQAAANSLAGMVSRVETYLSRNPDDGRGWEVLAPIYLRLQRYDDAVKARRNAARLLGETADRVAGIGEAETAAAGGVVTAQARAAFERAIGLDPANTTATLYLGLAAKQAGQIEEARRIWDGLIARAPADAEWVPFVRQALADLGGATADAAPAPRVADAPRAAPTIMPAKDLTPEQRDMVNGMVERLAARLQQDGSDVESWLRLVRSYLVLGEHDKAQTATQDARRALASDAEKLQRLDSGVKELGVKG